jgi:hypothetical protein
MSALIETISEQRFFVLNGCYSTDENGLMLGKGTQVEGPLVPLIKTAAQLWGRDLLRKFNKGHSEDDYPEIYLYDKSIAQILWSPHRSKWLPFSGVPQPELRPQKRRVIFENPQHTQHKLARSEDMSTPESDTTEVEALLKKWGPTRFTKAFGSVLEKFEREVVTIN